jgi:nucleotidyltransferase substrate binding protein (TIGR01987 family)
VELVSQRLATGARALATLEELLGREPTAVERDAAIQRFEYTYEAVWKAARAYLREVEGLEPGSPKQVVRAAFNVGLLDARQAEHALAVVDDRNDTVHTYNEQLAKRIHGRLTGHAALMRTWLAAMSERSAQP